MRVVMYADKFQINHLPDIHTRKRALAEGEGFKVPEER